MRVVPRPLRPVPDSQPPRDDLGEEFLFTGRALSQSSGSAPRIRPRTLIGGLVAACLLIAVVLVVRDLTASKPAPARAVVHSAPAVQPAPAASAGEPMSVVSSSLSPVTAGQGYTATVAVRNPTDVAADDVTVHVTLRDAAGRVVATQTRSLGTVASGETVKLTISGELDPSAGLPSGLEVSAVAARLEARA